jgi:uncharacterized protein YjbI with pentapeptide repeats
MCGVPSQPEPPADRHPARTDADATSAAGVALDHEVALADAVVAAPDWSGVEAEVVELRRVTLRDAILIGSRLERPRFTDVVLERCDLSGLMIVDPSFLRVELRECRVGALVLSRGRIEDVLWRGCRGDEMTLHELEGQRLELADDQLHALDVRGCRLRDLVVQDCGLPSSVWAGTRTERGSFRQTDLTGIGNPDGLAGSTFDAATLNTAAPALAAHLGITLTDDA